MTWNFFKRFLKEKPNEDKLNHAYQKISAAENQLNSMHTFFGNPDRRYLAVIKATTIPYELCSIVMNYEDLEFDIFRRTVNLAKIKKAGQEEYARLSLS